MAHYRVPEARTALWQLAETYLVDERFIGAIYASLLRHTNPENLPRLLCRLLNFTPDTKRAKAAAHKERKRKLAQAKAAQKKRSARSKKKKQC